jgi:hypothetical protein
MGTFVDLHTMKGEKVKQSKEAVSDGVDLYVLKNYVKKSFTP